MKADLFMQRLHTEAALQAKLQHTRFLPRELDVLSSWVATHAFLVILIASFLSAVTVALMTGSRW